VLIIEGAGSMQAESSRLKAIKGINPYLYFQLSAFSFELSAKIATGSTPDSRNRSRKNSKIRIVVCGLRGSGLTSRRNYDSDRFN
jgi:hypothetical protein